MRQNSGLGSLKHGHLFLTSWLLCLLHPRFEPQIRQLDQISQPLGYLGLQILVF